MRLKNYLRTLVLLLLVAGVVPVKAMIFRSDSVDAHWDTWCVFHHGTYYTYYLITEYGYGEGIGVATSADGVHWEDHGTVIRQSDRNTFYMGSGAVWKSPNFDVDGRFICNYSEHRRDETGKNTQNIFFAWSTDLIHWNKYDDSTMFRVDTLHYKKYGRWDCIFAFPREEGGYWGTWSANGKSVKGSVGIGYTEDGVSWTTLPPPVVETGANEAGAFYSINGTIHSMFIGHPDRGMWSHYAENIHGPYFRSPKNAHLLHRGPTAFARFLPTPDGLLAHHYHWTGTRLKRKENSVGRDRELTYISPFKKVIVDQEGILRWQYWEGNEALKGEEISASMISGKGNQLITKDLDFNTGIVAEMDVRLPGKNQDAAKVFIESGGKSYAVRISQEGHVDLVEIDSEGQIVKQFHTADREWNFKKHVLLRIFLRAGMMEVYLDEHFMECWTLGCYGEEELTVAIPDQASSIRNISLWKMSLKPARISHKVYSRKPKESKPQASQIGMGWAQNSINGVIFRRNSVVSHQGLQYASYYDTTGHVVLAKRKLGSDKWTIKETRYKGGVEDAHRSISIMADGEGFLHLSWNHHNNELHYCRSVAPGSLDLSDEMSMIGSEEHKVSYPEFYRMPDGDPLFFYRDGASGNGNLVLNRYLTKSGKWTRVQDVLIDGEGERNAYWQCFVDVNGCIHLSWVWRETGDIATNHDMCYAKSSDGGLTWHKSTGEEYRMPISEATAEYALRIPQKRELINTTSMYADSDGNPFIVSYFRDEASDVPQFFLIYYRNNAWSVQQISKRTMPFTLSGGGTKKIPISRPQIAVDNSQENQTVYIIYRDAEYGSRVRVASNRDAGLSRWEFRDLTDFSVESWEPSYDTALWKERQQLHIFVQKMGQGDGESLDDLPAQPVYIYEVQF